MNNLARQLVVDDDNSDLDVKSDAFTNKLARDFLFEKIKNESLNSVKGLMLGFVISLFMWLVMGLIAFY